MLLSWFKASGNYAGLLGSSMDLFHLPFSGSIIHFSFLVTYFGTFGGPGHLPLARCICEAITLFSLELCDPLVSACTASATRSLTTGSGSGANASSSKLGILIMSPGSGSSIGSSVRVTSSSSSSSSGMVGLLNCRSGRSQLGALNLSTSMLRILLIGSGSNLTLGPMYGAQVFSCFGPPEPTMETTFPGPPPWPSLPTLPAICIYACGVRGVPKM
mmetsp:Transcript_963/g.1947  ORF Transcript_963/g.1947 Transcript_963/m.1947 type:complete len:216 (-) Transcript_963:2188-2835(-)